MAQYVFVCLLTHCYIFHTHMHTLAQIPLMKQHCLVQQKVGGGQDGGGGGCYSSLVSPWKQAGEQHIPLGVLSETEDESSPH